MSADSYEATASGVLVKLTLKNGPTLNDQEIKCCNEDNGEPQTVAQAKELILTELQLPVENSRLRMKFSSKPHIEMEETALVKTYINDLTDTDFTEVELFYI